VKNLSIVKYINPVKIIIKKLTIDDTISLSAKHACNFAHARAIAERMMNKLDWNYQEMAEAAPAQEPPNVPIT
jgi:hypothetical protein